MPINKITLKLPDAVRPLLKNPESFIFKGLYKAFTAIATDIQGNVKRNVVPGWNMGFTTRNPYFTGKLNRSIVYQQNGLKTLVGSNVIYSEIQEYGGEIKPVKAKALFIPMSVRGRKVGAQKGGSDLKYGTDFIFSQGVKIKPKAYFQRGMEASINGIMEILESALKNLASQAGFK